MPGAAARQSGRRRGQVGVKKTRAPATLGAVTGAPFTGSDARGVRRCQVRNVAFLRFLVATGFPPVGGAKDRRVRPWRGGEPVYQAYQERRGPVSMWKRPPP